MPADLTGSSWRTEDFDIPAYLQRIGIEPGPASLELLEAVHQAHVRTLPFTNVDILLGTYPGAAPAAVQRQLIERRRGGYCFAHGQLMAAALEHLGFEVTRHLGRVGSPDRARTHTSLEVRLDDGAWFADPGFGFSIRGPMPLRDGAVRDEGGRLFELSLVGGGGGRPRAGRCTATASSSTSPTDCPCARSTCTPGTRSPPAASPLARSP